LTRQGRRTARHEIAVFAPDVAVVSELLSWPVAESLLPDIPWVFDAHNVETELFREMAGHASGVFDRVALGVDHRRVARQEKVLVRAADAVVAVSQDDADTLEKLGPLRTPVVVPSSVPMPVSPGPPAAEPVVLFVGTLDFPPNVEAVTELVTRVMPLVREQLPDAVVRVVGRNPTPAVRSLLARTSWVTFTEDAPSVEGHYRSARCVILPIRSGGGSRLKVYEALSYAVPIIGTSRAFSGIPVGDHAVILGETEDELAAGALRVLSDDEVAAKVGMAARALFVDRLSWEHAAVPLLDLIAELTARR
jgi:glycosyltransferase involved in cell wall biosynthesis